MKRTLINLLRWGIPLAILAYLFFDISRNDKIAQLQPAPGSWYLILLSLALVTGGTLVGILRWYVLVRALEIDFSVVSALKLGFLGELFNLVALGSVGGDLVKAVFIARDYPGRRAQAVSTVLVDRVLGLYAVLLLASISILVTGIWGLPDQTIQLICRATILLTLVTTFGLIALLVTGFISSALAAWLLKVPYVGGQLNQVAAAIGLYRRRWPTLLVAVGLGATTHALLAIGVFLIASAVMPKPPSVGAHLVIMPLATTTGILPLPASGLGAFEAVMEFLYQQVSGAVGGFIVALGYRVVSLVMVAIGAIVYFAAQREVSAAVREAATVRDA